MYFVAIGRLMGKGPKLRCLGEWEPSSSNLDARAFVTAPAVAPSLQCIFLDRMMTAIQDQNITSEFEE
ncbi:hypothetical protein Y032_0106g3762 [Ancylostoma ceylanicum]|uniref:Uncharacterized protein n=1 Tax=Ancylostoma ceylanicum TaxID=53326 RepID=A0A016TG03_9BILA|nr:hypothetical protein Y032_0106g3762 [Ancylostoma ceylanicum]